MRKKLYWKFILPVKMYGIKNIIAYVWYGIVKRDDKNVVR